MSQSGAAYLCLHLAHFARFLHSQKFSTKRKKCVSIDLKCSLTHRNAKIIFYPFDPLAHSAKPKRRTAMKFWYNQSDLSSNIFIKFDQNPTHRKRDMSRKSGTDRQTHRQTHTQIKFVGVYSLQNVTIKFLWPIKTTEPSTVFMILVGRWRMSSMNAYLHWKPIDYNQSTSVHVQTPLHIHLHTPCAIDLQN